MGRVDATIIARKPDCHKGRLAFGTLVQPLRRRPAQAGRRFKEGPGGDVRGDLSALGDREAGRVVGWRRLGQIGGKPEVELKLRRIAAIGDTPEGCILQLKQAGEDPANYEFTRLKPAFGGLA